MVNEYVCPFVRCCESVVCFMMCGVYCVYGVLRVCDLWVSFLLMHIASNR